MFQIYATYRVSEKSYVVFDILVCFFLIVDDHEMTTDITISFSVVYVIFSSSYGILYRTRNSTHFS